MKEPSNYEKKTRPLEFLRLDTLSPKPHLHPEIEMIMCFKGTVNAYINGVCHKLTSGNAIIVFPHQMHFYDVTETGDYGLFVFYPEITPTVKDIFGSYLPLSPIFVISENDRAVADILTAGYRNHEPYFPAKLTGYINIILSDNLEKLRLQSVTAEKTLTDSIMKYCAENFSEEITLDELAQKFAKSRSGISHIFNRVTGMSLPHYVNWLRVSSACRLLASTDLTVTCIASDVGFNTLRNFNRVFTSMMHQSPTEYREANNTKR